MSLSGPVENTAITAILTEQNGEILIHAEHFEHSEETLCIEANCLHQKMLSNAWLNQKLVFMDVRRYQMMNKL